jgi:uncharacterized protein with PIN domain
MDSPDSFKFIADINVGKLARWLRIMGYDTLIFKGNDDADMLTASLAENRTILTRDSQLMKRRLITRGQIKAILIKSDNTEEQLNQVLETLNLAPAPPPFALCLECNEQLVAKRKEEVRDSVPAYVFQTQNEYMECPACCRIYWKGTHWQAMTDRLNKLKKGKS